MKETVMMNLWRAWAGKGPVGWSVAGIPETVYWPSLWPLRAKLTDNDQGNLGTPCSFVPMWLPRSPRQAGPAIGLDSVLMLPWGSLLLFHGDYNRDLRGLRKNGLTVGSSVSRAHTELLGYSVCVHELGPGVWQHSAVSWFQEDLHSNLLLYWAAVPAMTSIFTQNLGLKHQGSLVFYL